MTLVEQVRLRVLHSAIVSHCKAIEDLFSVPVKVTVVARDPTNPEMEVVVTSDSYDAVIEAINRSRMRPEL